MALSDRGAYLSIQKYTTDDTMHYPGYNFIFPHHFGAMPHLQIIKR